MDGLQFFNPYEDIRFTANPLPHWQQKGAVYFVTFRLADAVPQRLRTQWESKRDAWLRVHPQPWSAECNANITIDFPAQSNAGSMPDTAPVFYGATIAHRLWRRRRRRSLIYSNSASNSSSRRSNNCSVLSMGARVVISTPAVFSVSSGNLEPPERKNVR